MNKRLQAALGALIFAASAAMAQPAPPAQPAHIAEAWFAHNAVLLMLGAADRIVVTVAKPATFPWMYRVAPVFGRAESISGSTMNAEELLRLNTDLVFTTPADPVAPALQRAGLPVVQVSFTDFASMLDCIDLTARSIGGPLATQRAAAYRRYLAQTLADVTAHIGAVAPAQRPRVLHVASLNPLKIDGADTIIDQWIRAAGGRNAADGLSGNMKVVSIEQVLAWNPDVIILAANAGALEASPYRSLWDSLDAVRRHKVYRNPSGVFPWDRYGPEVPLQVRWAASVLYPDRKPSQPLIDATRSFYATFFSYPLTAPDAQRILDGLAPL
jgi:iron complex transport system substrate-binding protein